jgi:flagellar motor switch protein FliM
MSCVDHMLGGPGHRDQPERPLTEIESGVIGGLIERLLGEMRYSLAPIVPLEPAVTGIEYSPQFAQVAGAADVMVVATFDLRIGERSERMTICLPFSGLKPFLARAAAPAPVSERERAQRAHAAELMQQRLADVPVPVLVRFRPSRQDPDTLTSLAVGDVLVLDHPAAAPLDVIVDDATFAHATPGTRGARLAALIVGTPKEKA